MLVLDKRLQARLYYLFMLADGEVVPEEHDRFREICESMSLDDERREKIINGCKDLPIVSGKDNSAKIIAEMSKTLSEYEKNSWPPISENKQAQAQVIWTLINLGYADSDYSEPEKNVITFLVDFWSFDRHLLGEMLDTAETMLALTKQKEWIKTTNNPYDTINTRIKHIDETIKQLFESMDITLLEADIA